MMINRADGIKHDEQAVPLIKRSPLVGTGMGQMLHWTQVSGIN